MEEDQDYSTIPTIMASLSTLNRSQFSDLIHSVSSLLHRHRCRLTSLLSSPALFSLTLRHLHALSLPQKSLLIAQHLLCTLNHLLHFLQPIKPPCAAAAHMKLRDLDAVLLLLLLCELRQHHPDTLESSSPLEWRVILCEYVSVTMLKLSGAGFSNGEMLMKYIETAAKCRRLVMGGGGGEKEGREAAASVATVVALPSVEVSESGRECAICKEEMKVGRDVCQLPCGHLFHWMCVLPWLRKRSTCPCCRHRLPTDDVFCEIRRLWDVMIMVARDNHFLI